MLQIKKDLRILMRTSMLSLLLLSIMMLLQACFPFGPEDIEEFDIVATFHDENYNFSAVKTYAMPDSVAHIDNSGGNPDLQSSRQFDDLILSQIAANMKAINYERIDNPDEADVVLTVAVTVQGFNLYGAYDYSNYWGYYTPGFDDGYNYGYGDYGSNTGYDLKTGTVMVNMADLDEASASTIPNPWLAIINGVTEQSFTNTSRRLIELINQCFAQSPYLGTSAAQ